MIRHCGAPTTGEQADGHVPGDKDGPVAALIRGLGCPGIPSAQSMSSDPRAVGFSCQPAPDVFHQTILPLMVTCRIAVRPGALSSCPGGGFRLVCREASSGAPARRTRTCHGWPR